VPRHDLRRRRRAVEHLAGDRHPAHELVRQPKQLGVGLVDDARLVHALFQERVDRRAQADRGVEDRIGSGLVGADRDQVLLLAVGGERAPQPGTRLANLGRHDLADQARDALEDVDRGVVARLRQGPRQHHVPVQDRPHGVGDRLVHVVAVDEHRVQPGDRAGRARAGALEQPGQQSEHRWRVAARGGGLADREADLALGHGKPRHGVHHQHHIAPSIPEVLGDRGGGERGTDPHQGRLVRRRHDHDRMRQRVPEVALDELADLAASLANQSDHVDLGRSRPRDHAHQRRLPDAGAGEDAEALAPAARNQGVERADAEAHPVADPGSGQRIRRCAGRVPPRDPRRRVEAIQRNPEAVDHAPQQRLADRHAERPARRVHTRARADPVELAERHEQRAPAAEPDDLGRN